MKRLTWMGGASALSVVLLAASTASAADHLDGTATKADPTADLSDVFTWVDGSNTVLVLNVYPGATTSSMFSNMVQYVFHTSSMMAYGATATTPLDVICTFDATQKISCWVGTVDYVTGDASATTGLASASGKVKVFAGLRDDPFFFNLQGFRDAAADVVTNAPTLSFDAAGCPKTTGPVSAALVADISHTAHGTMPAVDFFSPSTSYSGNILSLVVSVDTTLLTAGGPIVGVWASTNKGM